MNSGIASWRPVTSTEMSRVVARMPTTSRNMPRVTARRGPNRWATRAAVGAAKNAPRASDRKTQAGLERGVADDCLEEQRQREQQPELAERDDRCPPGSRTGTRGTATGRRRTGRTCPAFWRRDSTHRNTREATRPPTSRNGMIETLSSGHVQPRIVNGSLGRPPAVRAALDEARRRTRRGPG